MKILITGASGYIGSRLITQLSQNKTYELRATARNPEPLRLRIPKNVNVVRTDFTDEATLAGVFDGIDIAYYLIHSLNERKDFTNIEEKSAQLFVKYAEKAGVKKIIYLGGLVNMSHSRLSNHMSSRIKVGDILRESRIPTIAFRASVILGAGSLSFELIRALVERLPVMVTPKWVQVEAQPIFVNDVINYLQKGINYKTDKSIVFEIGGKDIVNYKQLMKGYAKLRGLKRIFIPIPILTPFISSLWLGLITPVYARIGRKLIESITVPTVVTDKKALSAFDIIPLNIESALKQCIIDEESEIKQQRWSDTLSATTSPKNTRHTRYHNRIIDQYTIDMTGIKTPFKPIEIIGAKNGWYAFNFLWKIRGGIDILLGGVGLRRGRRDPETMQIGDTLDWWRVEKFEAGKHLRLIAEMKVPGRAWLDFELLEQKGKTTLVQTVIFDPMGLWGILYWYSLLPLHFIIFKRMLKNIKKSVISI